MTEKYKTAKVSASKIGKANKLGISLNSYIDHLESLVEQGRTKEQDDLNSNVQSLIGTVASLAESLKHQRFITDAQALKIDEQTKMIGTLIELQTKLMNAYGADVEFIQALKKEITE